VQVCHENMKMQNHDDTCDDPTATCIQSRQQARAAWKHGDERGALLSLELYAAIHISSRVPCSYLAEQSIMSITRHLTVCFIDYDFPFMLDAHMFT
jgi:hypothetical protein